jgi:hypothetical protein
MGFWFGTFIFFLIQVVVTVSINKWAKRPNKGCVPRTLPPPDAAKGRERALKSPFPNLPTQQKHRLPHLLGITAVAQCWLV